MKLSDFLFQELYRITKTPKIFGYIGGMIAHLVDSLYLNEDYELVNSINEQGAGFAAEGYARASGKIGIAMATSGPGATNLVTPIADCFFDSIPVLFITGQVNTYEYKKFNIKQCGFQETDIVDIVRPITKYAKTITNPKDIKYELQKAIHLALSGRKGPVLLDIPMDIQRAEIDENTLEEYGLLNIQEEFVFDFKILENAKKPLVLVGNGVGLSNAREKLQKFLTKYNIPAVYSLLGVDGLLDDYEYNMGLIGTYGNRFGNLAFYSSDLLLVLGARLDIRQTGSNFQFMKDKTIVQVDIDERELNCSKFNKIKVKADISNFLSELEKNDLNINIKQWQENCLLLKDKFSNENKQYKLPNHILTEIFKILPEETVITSDVGQNQMWAAQSAVIKNKQRFLTSGGLGSMGFALPTAIGAAFVSNCVCSITGDGGFQMNIQELEVLKRRNLPIKIIVLNNKNLGMVRTFQDLYFDGRRASTVVDYSVPDFSQIANAYGIKSKTVDAKNFNIVDVIDNLLSNEPFVLNIEMELETQVEPRLLFGNSIENAHPILAQEEIRMFLN